MASASVSTPLSCTQPGKLSTWPEEANISAQFEAALRNIKPKVLWMTESGLESNNTIWYFLDLLQKGDIPCKPPVTGILGVDSWFKVALFVVKYKSELGRSRLIMNIILQILNRNTRIMHAWIIGAILRDLGLCLFALRASHIHGQWPKQRGVPYLPGRNELDPCGIPRELAEVIPRDYLQALVTTWDMLKPTDDHNAYEDLSDCFEFCLLYGTQPDPNAWKHPFWKPYNDDPSPESSSPGRDPGSPVLPRPRYLLENRGHTVPESSDRESVSDLETEEIISTNPDGSQGALCEFQNPSSATQLTTDRHAGLWLDPPAAGGPSQETDTSQVEAAPAVGSGEATSAVSSSGEAPNEDSQDGSVASDTTLVEETAGTTTVGAFDALDVPGYGYHYNPRCRRDGCDASCGGYHSFDDDQDTPTAASVPSVQVSSADQGSVRNPSCGQPSLDSHGSHSTEASAPVPHPSGASRPIAIPSTVNPSYRHVARCRRGDCDGSCGTHLSRSEQSADRATRAFPSYTPPTRQVRTVNRPTVNRPTVSLPEVSGTSDELTAADPMQVVNTGYRYVPRCRRANCDGSCGSRHGQGSDEAAPSWSAALPTATFRVTPSPRRRPNPAVGPLRIVTSFPSRPVRALAATVPTPESRFGPLVESPAQLSAEPRRQREHGMPPGYTASQLQYAAGASSGEPDYVRLANELHRILPANFNRPSSGAARSAAPQARQPAERPLQQRVWGAFAGMRRRDAPPAAD